jgi:hypothetical protein
VRKACLIIAGASTKDPQLERLAPRLIPILNDLHTRILGPIYRSHPDLERASLREEPNSREVRPTGSRGTPPPSRVARATRKDIGRRTAVRLEHALWQIQQDASKVASEAVGHAASKEATEAARESFLDATAELTFASKVAFDAYPDLWKRRMRAALIVPRTAESDASFRRSAPPLGSVKLSDAALHLVKAFMRQLRREVPHKDHIASIGWVIDRRSKGPDDTAWTSTGAGLDLGAYLRSQVPGDIIDDVGGVEIIFTAEDPSMFAGKTIDLQDRQFVIRD